MVTSFKEAAGDMVMYSFEFVLFLFCILRWTRGSVRIWRPRFGDSPGGAVRAGDGNPGLGYWNGIMYGCGRRPERKIHK
jgi:hypothetical protein